MHFSSTRLLSGGGDITYEAILMLAVFLAAQWYLARLFMALKLPTIPIEIGVGLVFGPYGLDLIPDFSHTYSPLQLLGFIGVGIVIFESGMHLSIKKVFNMTMGPHVVVVATLGTALPIVLGMGLMSALGSDLYPNGLAAGFALAPTSVGISLTLLGRAKQLNSRCGQIIMSAAFLDDIFSIICLVVLINLSGGNLNPVNHVIVPLISSFAFVGFGVVGSIYLPIYFPKLIDVSAGCFQRLQVANRSLDMVDEAHMFWMLICYLLLSWVGDLIGSSLLGCFVAGMLFSCVPRSHHIWEKQFKRISRWLLRIFFSATVAFSIDVGALFTAEAFWKGLIIGLIPCLLAKIVAGAFVGKERWVVGIAMMARGEFAYLVAQEGHDLEMLTDDEYSIVVWALLWATVLTPLVFDKVLKTFVEDDFVTNTDNARSARIGGDKFTGTSSFLVHYFGSYQVGIVHDITEALHAMGFEIKKSISEEQQGFGKGTFEVHIRAAITMENKYGSDFMDRQTDSRSERRSMKYKMVTDLSDEKLDEIAKHLKECFKDAGAQIIFEPTLVAGVEEEQQFIAIELFGLGHSKLIDDVKKLMEDEMGVVVRGVAEHNKDARSESRNNKMHYTSVYCSKADETNKAQPIRGHIQRSKSQMIAVTETDVQKFTKAIQLLIKEMGLTHCNVLVRIMSEHAVVYSEDEQGLGPQTSSAGADGGDGQVIRADKKFSLSTIELPPHINNGVTGTTSPGYGALNSGDDDGDDDDGMVIINNSKSDNEMVVINSAADDSSKI